MNIAMITAFGVGGATIIGALGGFLIRHVDSKIFAVAAGIMLSAALMGLIIPSLEYGAPLTTVIGIFTGALVLNGADRLLYRNNSSHNQNAGLLFVAAIAIHNFPEGIAAGVGCGTGSVSDALLIAAGIALQNLPEGMIIIAPMLKAGFSPAKTLLIAIATGLVEVVGAALGYFAVSFASAILPFALSFAGGTMLYVICTEMLPDAKDSPYAVLVGFSLMILISGIF